MLFLASLIGTVLFVLLFRKALKKVPIVFYLVALALVGAYVYLFLSGGPWPFSRDVLLLVQRCTVSLAFFTLVMFAGVFPDDSPIRGLLIPLRRELSILGAIFASGHVIVYAVNFLPRLFSGSIFARSDLATSIILASLLTAVLIVLTITSFVWVRKLMKPESWKRVQLLAYPFFALVYVHLAFILIPAVLAGSTALTLNLAIYTLLFASYLVLRIRRALASSTNKAQQAKMPTATQSPELV
ncbi:MAG: ferric reductase-like transmembrane domain-containing protein [Coriobacteriaceae bacterium]|jgi:DMSO/TMAO reductase YedYZ heme-binding membrane subunit|nr:ferric reductase-like transmembrane domain-containing protein [Coriobacteriaceae bacterium]